MQNKYITWLAGAIAALIILIAVFSLGVMVGFHKARFTQNWERGYGMNVGKFAGIPFQPNPSDPALSPHGVFGNIISKAGADLIIKGIDNNEKTVIMSTSTSIRQNFNNVNPTDLKINDAIIVIGEPNDQGQIDAKFIRVLNQP